MRILRRKQLRRTAAAQHHERLGLGLLGGEGVDAVIGIVYVIKLDELIVRGSSLVPPGLELIVDGLLHGSNHLILLGRGARHVRQTLRPPLDGEGSGRGLLAVKLCFGGFLLELEWLPALRLAGTRGVEISCRNQVLRNLLVVLGSGAL